MAYVANDQISEGDVLSHIQHLFRTQKAVTVIRRTSLPECSNSRCDSLCRWGTAGEFPNVANVAQSELRGRDGRHSRDEIVSRGIARHRSRDYEAWASNFHPPFDEHHIVSL